MTTATLNPLHECFGVLDFGVLAESRVFFFVLFFFFCLFFSLSLSPPLTRPGEWRSRQRSMALTRPRCRGSGCRRRHPCLRGQEGGVVARRGPTGRTFQKRKAKKMLSRHRRHLRSRLGKTRSHCQRGWNSDFSRCFFVLFLFLFMLLAGKGVLCLQVYLFFVFVLIRGIPVSMNLLIRILLTHIRLLELNIDTLPLMVLVLSKFILFFFSKQYKTACR
jgi:hypothetical protein